MKKKTKNLLVLVLFLAVLVGGYFALDLIPEDTGEEEQDTAVEPVEVTEFATEDIAFYCYYNSVYEMGFNITEEGYTHYRDELFPANADSVENQLAAVGNLTALQVVEGTDKAEYGLDSPQTTIAVTLKDGTERTFFIGDSALFEAADYLLDVENNVIYLIEEDLYDEFNVEEEAMKLQEEENTEEEVEETTTEDSTEETIE